MKFVNRTAARGADETVLVLLPDRPQPGDHLASWWRVVDGHVFSSGQDAAWVELATVPGVDLIALAPTSALRFHFSDRAEDAADRQAAAVARMEALDRSATPAETTHGATAPIGGRPDRLLTALVANDRMREWIDWLAAVSIDPVHIVPAAMAVPMGEKAVRAVVGHDAIVASDHILFADEPALADLLLDSGEDVAPVARDEVMAGLARIAVDPAPDLRSGPFARRHALIERAMLKQLALLMLAIVLVTTLTAIVEIVRLNRSSDRLDDEALALARTVAGNNVTLETAEAAIAARSGSVNGLGVPLAAVLSNLQAEQAVATTSLGYGAGTTSLTLAGPDQASINRVLLGLQRDGYAVTATPRQGSDGRTMADVTIRTVK